MQDSNETQIQTFDNILTQLNSTNPEKPLWIKVDYPNDSLYHLVRPYTDFIDTANIMYLGALGFKIEFYKSLQLFLSTTEATIPNNLFPEDKLILTAEIDETSLLNLSNKNYFNSESLNPISDCVKALKTISSVFTKNFGKVSVGISHSGFIMTCKGSRPDTSSMEILDLLYNNLGLGKSGFKIKCLKEHTNSSVTCFHLEFVSFLKSEAMSFVLADNFIQRVNTAINSHIASRHNEPNGSLMKINLPMASIVETRNVILFNPHAIDGKPPISSENHSDLIEQKSTLLKLFSGLTVEIFPEAKWIGIINKDNNIVIFLKGLTNAPLLYCFDAFQGCNFHCEIININDNPFIQINNLAGFISQNKEFLDAFFVNKKSLLENLKKHEATFLIVKAFLRKQAHSDMQYLGGLL